MLNNPDSDRHLSTSYPLGFEIKFVSDTDLYVSYLDLFLEFDNLGKLKTGSIDRFILVCGNISQSPVHGV